MISVLHVTNMWPNSESPTSGTFVKELVDELSKTDGIHDVYYINARSTYRGYIKAIGELKTFLKNNRKYDLIHTQYAHSAIVALLASRVPLISQFHGEYGYCYCSVNKTDVKAMKDKRKARRDAMMASLASRSAAGAIVVNNDHMSRVWCRSVVSIPIGVNTEVFHPIDRDIACNELGYDPSVTRILFPSNPERPEKNYPMFIASMQEMCSMAGRYEVVALKNMNREVVALTMNAVDVMVMTSYSEASPTVVKEACLCNLPVVSVPVGDVTWQLKGITNCIVTEYDKVQIAQATAKVLSTRSRSNGWYLRKKTFSIKETAIKTMSFYNYVLEGLR